MEREWSAAIKEAHEAMQLSSKKKLQQNPSVSRNVTRSKPCLPGPTKMDNIWAPTIFIPIALQAANSRERLWSFESTDFVGGPTGDSGMDA